MSFLETPRFPLQIGFGSEGGPTYNTNVIELNSGHEKRNQNWTYPRSNFNVASGVKSNVDLSTLVDFFHAVQGRTFGFRFKDKSDYLSSANPRTTITNTDQTLGTGDGATVAFQLVKIYTSGALSTTRQIQKPVSGTTIVSIDGVSEDRLTIDTTTGIVTFNADNQISATTASSVGSLTNIQFNSHGLTTGQTIYLSTFTGDWASLNGSRYAVTYVDPNNITIAYDSSAFAAYSSNGGQMNTIPQSGEIIKAGFEFDIPVRFNTDHLSTSIEHYQAGAVSVPIVEIRDIA